MTRALSQALDDLGPGGDRQAVEISHITEAFAREQWWRAKGELAIREEMNAALGRWHAATEARRAQWRAAKAPARRTA